MIVALDCCGLATRVEVIVHRDLKQACKGRLAGVEPSKGEGEGGGGGEEWEAEGKWMGMLELHL